MDYLTRLKNLKTPLMGSDKSAKTHALHVPTPQKEEEKSRESAFLGVPGDNGLASVDNDEISKTPLLGGAKSAKTENASVPSSPVAPAPSYIKRCETCGGTNWGCVGSDAHGEVWGYLTCHFKAPATCTDCGGDNIVTDAVGAYCVDCRKRPGAEPAESQPEKEPVRIGVTWARGESG
jgi:hypothetical protein